MTKTKLSLLVIGGLAASYALVALDTIGAADTNIRNGAQNNSTEKAIPNPSLHKAIYILPDKKPPLEYRI